uniref:Uncharacterized protein n=1 Tax=Coccidioides posadasii RMSCC 3488 TaxID=454284 RepID=A0A0J6FF25_COCPO|nr:hypothetical protein CPAG_05246 [Coccidioides posadasii RMSCC 3488]
MASRGCLFARICYKNRTSLYKKVGRMKATYKSHVFPRLGQALQLIAKRKLLSQTTGNILLHQDVLEKTIIITNPENVDGNSGMLIGLNLAKEIMQQCYPDSTFHMSLHQRKHILGKIYIHTEGSSTLKKFHNRSGIGIDTSAHGLQSQMLHLFLQLFDLCILHINNIIDSPAHWFLSQYHGGWDLSVPLSESMTMTAQPDSAAEDMVERLSAQKGLYNKEAIPNKRAVI